MPTTVICQILTCMHKHVMAVFMLKHLNIMAFQVTSDDAEINAYKFTAKITNEMEFSQSKQAHNGWSPSVLGSNIS